MSETNGGCARAGARIFPFALDFLLPYLAQHADFTASPEDADIILAMNDFSPGAVERLRGLDRRGKPLVWWTIEDPNSFDAFLPQAAQADYVFTSDECCIPAYRERLGHGRVLWLPLAASPVYHEPRPLAADAAEFVLSANWYENEARRWGVATVVEPLRQAGRTLALFCYENCMWPPEYQPYWRGATNCRTVADQYRHGAVVLGLNNQRTGMDGRGPTVMTSMRTFEALACGKPFLASHSDAYERLGFRNGVDMIWVKSPEEALEAAAVLSGAEGQRIAARGREKVLAAHTYGHRMACLIESVMS